MTYKSIYTDFNDQLLNRIYNKWHYGIRLHISFSLSIDMSKLVTQIFKLITQISIHFFLLQTKTNDADANDTDQRFCSPFAPIIFPMTSIMLIWISIIMDL